MIKRLLFFALGFFLIPNLSSATHISGMELSYTMIPTIPNAYLFQVRYYRDCGGPTSTSQAPLAINLCYANSCTTTLHSASLPKIVGAIATNPPSMNGATIYNSCNIATTCTNISSTVNGFQQWWYQDTILLDTTCNNWHFWVDMCCRNGSTMNVGPQNPSTYDFYIDARFNNLVSVNNNSPLFLYADSSTKIPTPKACINFPFVHNGGVMDADGDSLFVETISPRSGNGCINQLPLDILSQNGIPSYNLLSSYGNPLQCNNTYFLDSLTGIFGFIPSQVGSWTLCHRVNEYRNGQWIGSTTRDMQITVENCSGNTSTDTVHVCQGDNYQFPDSTWFFNAQYDTVQVSVFNSAVNSCDSFAMTVLYLDSLSNGVVLNNGVLSSLDSNASSYQWIQCNPYSLINGATAQNYTPSMGGDYAVIVTNGNCIDTSACINYLLTQNNPVDEEVISIYPNPAQDFIQLKGLSSIAENTIHVYDIAGQEIPIQYMKQGIDIRALKPGMYLLLVQGKKYRFRKE